MQRHSNKTTTAEMANIGKVPEFDSKKEDFDSYLERFERWLSANDIDAGKNADVFVSVLGPTEYGLLKNLVAPKKVRFTIASRKPCHCISSRSLS